MTGEIVDRSMSMRPRTNRYAERGLWFADTMTKEYLTKLYVEQHKSARDISELSGHKKETIARYLDRYGIHRRGTKEATILKIQTDASYRKKLTRRQKQRPHIHDEALKLELEEIKKQGFRCIPIGLLRYPKPDVIAIKDGKIFAIEVELSTIDYEKYNSIKDFDDIIWIDKRKGDRRLKRVNYE